MEIDLSLSVGQREQMREFMERENPVIEMWRKAIYEPNIEDWDTEAALADVNEDKLWMLKRALKLDRKLGVSLAVELFSKAFDFVWPVKVVFLDGEHLGVKDAASFAFAGYLNITKACIQDPRLEVGHRALESVSDNAMIGSIAHEMWHAHQREMIVEWLRKSGGLLDLEEESPDTAMKGALYMMNSEVYFNPKEDKELYRSQLVEAEANKIYNEVFELAFLA